LACFVAAALCATTAFAQNVPTPEQRLADLEAYVKNTAPATSLAGVAGPGHNTWLMVSAALVLFMTLPGLALFYGGLVRKRNVLSVLAQCLGLTALVSLIWWACGYSLCFAKGGLLGGFDYAFLRGVDSTPNVTYGAWVSENVFCMYQMMFAIITPALIVGAIAERMKYSAVLLFCGLWMFAVYFPTAHLMWGDGGWFNGVWNPEAKVKSIDFAGGIVVHMTSGWSALVLCILLGKRRGFGREPLPPHSMVACMTGTGMLWVGWYGFNAGSAVASDAIAANAFTATTMSAAVGCAVWGLCERVLRGKISVLGLCSGAVAGLATVTPASGFVSVNGAMLIGVVAGFSTYFACSTLKTRFGYDDSLDTFGIHAVGGTLGSILAGVLATGKANPNLNADHIKGFVGNTLWVQQIIAAGAILVLSVVATVVLYFVVKFLCGGVRVSAEIEATGLDLNEHGEEGYLI